MSTTDTHQTELIEALARRWAAATYPGRTIAVRVIPPNRKRAA